MVDSKAIDGQCGTCLFSAGFESDKMIVLGERLFVIDVEGVDEYVQCSSVVHAHEVGAAGDLAGFGWANLLRLEDIAEKEFRCPQWISKGEICQNISR